MDISHGAETGEKLARFTVLISRYAVLPLARGIELEVARMHMIDSTTVVEGSILLVKWLVRHYGVGHEIFIFLLGLESIE